MVFQISYSQITIRLVFVFCVWESVCLSRGAQTVLYCWGEIDHQLRVFVRWSGPYIDTGKGGIGNGVVHVVMLLH